MAVSKGAVKDIKHNIDTVTPYYRVAGLGSARSEGLVLELRRGSSLASNSLKQEGCSSSGDRITQARAVSF